MQPTLRLLWLAVVLAAAAPRAANAAGPDRPEEATGSVTEAPAPEATEAAETTEAAEATAAAAADQAAASEGLAGEVLAEAGEPVPVPPPTPLAAQGSASGPGDANSTEQARQDLEAIVAASGNLRGASGSGWGHGIFGETCCMCSMRVGWNTVLYAAADYSNFFGGHAANWWCQQGCEVKCHIRGGHLFGCYDEQHLLAMDRMYGHRSGYQILHDQHFGNIC